MVKNLMRVTAVDYKVEDDLPVVQLAGRDEYGERRTAEVIGTVPHFYTRRNESVVLEDHEDVRRVHDSYESYDGIPLSRIDVRVPGNAGARSDDENLVELFDETWESDIPFYRRVSIDYGLSGYIRIPEGNKVPINEIETDVDVSADDAIEPRKFIADIEVVNRGDGGFEEMMEEYDCPITHITIWDSQEDEYICLALDPDGQVAGSEVKSLLEDENDSTEVSEEVDRSIILRKFETEKDLLTDFIDTFRQRRPDIASGWNFIDFDWDYLLGRIDKFDRLSIHQLSDIGWANGYQTERKIDCIPAFDMLTAYQKMTIPAVGRMRSYSLDYVSKQELGIGKLPNMSVAHSYDHDRSRLTAYNIMDVMLCVALERKQAMHEFFYELAELSQVQIYDTFSEMRLIDGYIMSRSDDNEILPAANDDDVPENAGGLVLHPSSGVHDWVSVLDLKSLYPSCMITWNLSPESIHWYDEDEPEDENYINIPWLPDADHSEGGDFGLDDIEMDMMWSDLDEEGIIPKYLKQLFPERAKRKSLRNQYDPDDPEYDTWDRKQSAVKVVMNAFYGVCSMDYWRLATEGLGDAITSAARYALWSGKEISEDEGYEILYGDTDSIFLSIADPDENKETCITRGESIENIVNDRIDDYVVECGLSSDHPLLIDDLHGTSRHTLVYEFEKLYCRFFQPGSKKRYGGNIVWKEGKDIDGKIDVTGFESQRSDSPEITEEVQPQVINRILDGQGFEEVSEYVKDIVDSIEAMDIDLSEVALPKSLNQPLEEYGNTPAARACRFSNEHFGSNWIEGSDPWMIYISETPPMTPKTDVIALGWDEEIPEGYELDMNKTLERALERPLKPILDDIGWSFTELKTGAQTQSADVTGEDWGSYDMMNQEDQSEEQAVQSEWGW